MLQALSSHLGIEATPRTEKIRWQLVLRQNSGLAAGLILSQPALPVLSALYADNLRQLEKNQASNELLGDILVQVPGCAYDQVAPLLQQEAAIAASLALQTQGSPTRLSTTVTEYWLSQTREHLATLKDQANRSDAHPWALAYINGWYHYWLGSVPRIPIRAGLFFTDGRCRLPKRALLSFLFVQGTIAAHLRCLDFAGQIAKELATPVEQAHPIQSDLTSTSVAYTETQPPGIPLPKLHQQLTSLITPPDWDQVFIYYWGYSQRLGFDARRLWCLHAIECIVALAKSSRSLISPTPAEIQEVFGQEL